MSPETEIQIIAVMTAVACSLVGVFLVLRRMALMSDAITHSILLGIVLAFFAVENTASPFLIIAAALTGVLTVAAVEALNRTNLVREDTSIGLVFPLFFSLGVILISRYAGDVHLDLDAVLLGELAFAPFNRMIFGGADWGARFLWVITPILVANAAFVFFFYKELKLSTFDAALAAALGFSPVLLQYLLMTLVSVTAVGAFDAVGSILVVALMIAPPAAAYLLTERLSRMLAVSAVLGAGAAIGGYWLARLLDASIAGSIASIAGAIFGLTWIFAPRQGLLAAAFRRARQRREFAEIMLVIHLHNHEDSPEAAEENCIPHLHSALGWSEKFAAETVSRAERADLIRRVGADLLDLTERGRTTARDALTI